MSLSTHQFGAPHHSIGRAAALVDSRWYCWEPNDLRVLLRSYQPYCPLEQSAHIPNRFSSVVA